MFKKKEERKDAISSDAEKVDDSCKWIEHFKAMVAGKNTDLAEVLIPDLESKVSQYQSMLTLARDAKRNIPNLLSVFK